MSELETWVQELDAELIAKNAEITSDDFELAELSELFVLGVDAPFAANELMLDRG